MDWKGKKVAVTGAGGFIGSHLVEALVRSGAEVRAMVHYNSGGSLANLAYADKQILDAVEVQFGDVQDSGSVEQLIRGCDCVFHLAALIGIPYSYIAPRSYVATNISGTLNVLDAVRHMDIPRMVHTSTSETYGSALYEPIDEDHPLQGQSPYSASKIGADKLAESYYLSFETPVATIRPFNTYGPRQSARAVIPTIISQLVAGKEEIELGSLSPQRDLTFVADTALGFMAVAAADAALGQVTNVGNGKTITIGDLAEMIVAMVNPTARIVSHEDRVRPEKSEVTKLICNNEKAAKTTGWQPSVSLEQGLEKTIQFVRDHIGIFAIDRYSV